MNKVILLGRLTRDPEVRYSQGPEPLAIVRFGLAVNRRFKRQGEPDADFFNCVAFGKTGEFTEKYFKKGQQISIVGRLQTGSYEKNGQKIYTTDIVVEEQFFADSKNAAPVSDMGDGFGAPPMPSQAPAKPVAQTEEFFAIDESLEDEDLPF